MNYTGSPGFKFALDTGMDGVKAQMAKAGMLHSGNTLSALMKYGTGLAMQDYNTFADRNLREKQGDQQFSLGTTRNANDFTLGTESNANTANNNWWNYDLGKEQNANTAANNENNFNLNWFNADTNRGNAASNDYWKGNDNMLKYWQQFGKTAGMG